MKNPSIDADGRHQVYHTGALVTPQGQLTKKLLGHADDHGSSCWENALSDGIEEDDYVERGDAWFRSFLRWFQSSFSLRQTKRYHFVRNGLACSFQSRCRVMLLHTYIESEDGL